MSPSLPLPAEATAPLPLDLVAHAPACFDWTAPRPLKRRIHKELIARALAATGRPDEGDEAPREAARQHLWARVRAALSDYCTRPAYLAALRCGAVRIDLDGHPAGSVTAREAAAADAQLRGETRPPRPVPATAPAPALPHDAPLQPENSVPGHLELTVKFSQLPTPVQVQAGMKIGIQTDRALVVVTLPSKAWKKLTKAQADWPHWVAALSGRLGAQAPTAAGPIIVLEQPAVQVFEKKAKPAPAADGS